MVSFTTPWTYSASKVKYNQFDLQLGVRATSGQYKSLYILSTYIHSTNMLLLTFDLICRLPLVSFEKLLLLLMNTLLTSTPLIRSTHIVREPLKVHVFT